MPKAGVNLFQFYEVRLKDFANTDERFFPAYFNSTKFD